MLGFFTTRYIKGGLRTAWHQCHQSLLACMRFAQNSADLMRVYGSHLLQLALHPCQGMLSL